MKPDNLNADANRFVPLTGTDWHPLELIPYFRRWPHSMPRDLVYTFIWNTLFGLVLGLTTYVMTSPGPILRFAWMQFVMTQTIGYSIHLMYELCDRAIGPLLRRWPHWPRWAHVLYHTAVPIIGLFLGYWLGFGLLDLPSARRWAFSPRGAWSIALFAFMVLGMMAGLFAMRSRQDRTDAELALERQRVLDAERRALESQLKMLQAQIEPHFLYNTLANAVGLIGPAPDRARLLLERLIEYLRTSLAASRQNSTTLGHELGTLRAYLELMQVRMGRRLRFSIDCNASLDAIELPPMLLQPLVENAIQHGLEPLIDGGDICIAAIVVGGQLEVTIADSGAGLQPGSGKPGGGVGLSNIRERLATLFPGHASLTLAEQQPCGIKATLLLPLTTGALPSQSAV
jgi:hypothetical protein